jgi:hypothetical protein
MNQSLGKGDGAYFGVEDVVDETRRGDFFSPGDDGADGTVFIERARDEITLGRYGLRNYDIIGLELVVGRGSEDTEAASLGVARAGLHLGFVADGSEVNRGFLLGMRVAAVAATECLCVRS